MRNWMKDYLSGREMRTAVKYEKSEWREVTSAGTNYVFDICK